MVNESLRSMISAGQKITALTNLQNVEPAAIKRQAFLEIKAKHGIVQVV